jgi:hypothetical protein
MKNDVNTRSPVSSHSDVFHETVIPTLDGVPASMIAVSSLTSETLSLNASTINQTMLAEYERGINSQANMRENLVEYFDKMLISTASTIKIQATSLAQLTQSTNQLTRTTLVRSTCLLLLLSTHVLRSKRHNDALNWLQHSCPSLIESHSKMFVILPINSSNVPHMSSP